MKKIFLIILLSLYTLNAYGIESKIMYKIGSKIITNIDIKDEVNHLLALNKELKNLDKDKIFNIAVKSITREKIKENEVLKKFKNLDVDQNYINSILKNIYTRLGLKTINDFKAYLKVYKIDISLIEEKVKIDSLWNQIIVEKYNSKLNINIDKMKEDILNNKIIYSKNYLLSEIIFEVKEKKQIKKKYLEVKNSIQELGFQNTALIYSISDTAKNEGNVGWVNEKSLNEKIKKELYSLKINQISSPISVPGGILILMIKDIRNEQVKIDSELELKKMINFEKNKQLSQYSKIYFNRVKKNLEFDG